MNKGERLLSRIHLESPLGRKEVKVKTNDEEGGEGR
jgi:hypothetical protein